MAPTPTPRFRMSTPSTVSSSCPSSSASYLSLLTPTPTVVATPVWTCSTGNGLPDDCYDVPSGVLLEEHTRVAWVASWSRMIPVSDERFLGLDQLGRLASPHPEIVFKALIKVIRFIRQTHQAMTSVCAQQTKYDASLRSKAVLAYQGLKSLMNISEAVIAPHPDNLFAVLRMFNHFWDMFSFAEAEFFPFVAGLFVENYKSFAAMFYRILGVLTSVVRRTFEALEVWMSNHADEIPLDVGVHDITKYVTLHITLLSEHGVLLKSALNVSHGTREASAGAAGAENLESLMAALLSHLEKTLERISKWYQFSGLQWLFLVNNMNFILLEKVVAEKFGDDWLLKRWSILEIYISRYLDVSWTPVVSCLRMESRVILGCFNKQPAISAFNIKFETTYATQMTWQIEDPQLRKHMREAVIEAIIPTYCSYLEKHKGKQTKFLQYTPKELKDLLSELFEG
ncbi:hypothetical protein QOZ80_2AG0109600 [Eleusine coracana subsp. coracana]|nr:hypothetical protein QOZ80_2AG0109600 [Eleusine coracana subsp. coracana]